MTLPPGVYTPEEAVAAMEAEARSAAAEYDTLKRRVTVLEAQVELLTRIAVNNGDASINAVRAARGLPDFPEGKT